MVKNTMTKWTRTDSVRVFRADSVLRRIAVEL